MSKKYNVSIDNIINENKIDDFTKLSVGTEILIPSNIKKTYIVEKGDTLFSVSKKFNLPLSELMKYNNIKDDDILSLGQELIIVNDSSIPSIVDDVDTSGGNNVELVSHSELPYWPVEGNITDYSGRIQGVLIEGSSGDYIKAVSKGRVIWYDSFKGIGKVVLIEGDNGYDYLYGTKEDLNVSLGVYISAGDKIGRLKENNTSIIFSVFKNGKPLPNIANAPR
ncbi:MAG: LysM peptidoglycan-binding domain-containing protein [Spirochaetales bacterium]|nr:LysM peptidoglycan-binding domain-containing protein [Spirochaetales bacterium]